MSETAHEYRTVPEWTIGDRMRKAREHAGLSQTQLATRAGIGRTTVVAYESGRSFPSRPNLLSWSMATGISYEWMCHSDTQPCGPRGITAGLPGNESRSNYMQSSYAAPIARRAA